MYNLKGYTFNSRTKLFAYRLAPIQINYLGYPGTLGASFIDYMIADKILIPKEQRSNYSEKIIYLPNSYQPNDNKREISKKITTKNDFGLPNDSFVFCCFNTTYKITSEELNIWSSVLKKVQNSILWLIDTNEIAKKNLINNFQENNIDQKRIIFAKNFSHHEHLERIKHADLFLDTFNYNAGAVANDALWCGLPVLTHQGQSYVARMVSSLLTAIDMPELITTTGDDYEQCALDLATNSKKLKSIKAKLALNKDNTSLFKTELFTSNLETAYTEMYERYVNGEKPEHLLVEGKENYQDIP